MRRRDRERELERELRELPLADEAEAEERAWEIVRAAHAEHTPRRPSRPARRAALVGGIGALALAIGLSPAGARMGELVTDVVGIGEEDARPALRSLPAAGELLVESEQGVWVVDEDGSKRLLGDYEQATWSPRGLYVVVGEGRELAAVDPLGEVRWSLSAPGPVRDPRWGGLGFDTRIAYRSGDDLRVVAGDGTGDRLVASEVAEVAPAWRPPGDSKLEAVDPRHVVTYVTGGGRVRSVDADSGEGVETTEDDLERLSIQAGGGDAKRALSPDDAAMATLEHVGRRDELVVQRDGGGGRRVLFSARGQLTGPTWSPDGRWLLVGWPAADQWLFISVERPDRVVAFDRISEQFDPGGDGGGRFPLVSDWILPQR